MESYNVLMLAKREQGMSKNQLSKVEQLKQSYSMWYLQIPERNECIFESILFSLENVGNVLANLLLFTIAAVGFKKNITL